MADEFDPLKQKDNNQQTEELYARIQKPSVNKNNTSDDDLLRPQFENIVKLVNPNQSNQVLEQKPKEEMYHTLNFTNNAYKAPVRSTNPFNEDIQTSVSPPSSPTGSSVIQKLPEGKPITAEQEKKPTVSNIQAKPVIPEQHQDQYWQTSSGYHDPNYEVEPTGDYYPQEYYENYSTYRRRGVTAAIDRLVQRFPTLGLFYRPSTASARPPPEPYENYNVDHGQQYIEQESDEPPQLVDANQTFRELTADELALNERYSNKARTQIIQLQKRDQTQPVDLCIHHDTYTIYSCDVGRGVVEIFDMYGKLLHVIDDQTTIKFQPTSIAVGDDGTIIVASHFNHRLHMYSPDDHQNENASDAYQFKQYKLGSPGHNIHQFYYPAGIAIDYSDGYLYVSDRGNFRIKVLRPEGVCERVINLVLPDKEQTPIPAIQIAHQQHINQIVCLVGAGDALGFIPKDADGPTYVEPFYVLDSDGLGLQGASGLAVDSDDRIFISDTGHHRIVICTSDGNYITHIGGEGDGPGQLRRPCGLDITMDGTIVIADSGNKRLQLFGSVREQTIEENKPKDEKLDGKNSLLIKMDGNAM